MFLDLSAGGGRYVALPTGIAGDFYEEIQPNFIAPTKELAQSKFVDMVFVESCYYYCKWRSYIMNQDLMKCV